MTVAELIALLQERPPWQRVLVAYTPQGCPDDVDGYGSEPRVGQEHALLDPFGPARLGVEPVFHEVTVIYALDA